MYIQKRSSFIAKAAIVVLLMLSTAYAGKIRISKERAEQIKKEAKTWVPYDYETHPFRDVEDITKMTGLIIEGQSSDQSTHLMGKLMKAVKAVSGPLAQAKHLKK